MRVVAALAVAAVAVAGGGEGADDAARALTAIEAHYEGVRDLRAAFTQTSHTPALGETSTALGEVVVERPGRMRWQYAPPDARVVLLTDSAIRVYSPEDEQLQIAPMTKETVSPTALSFLLGEGSLAKDFSARAHADPQRPELGLELVPKQGDSSFESLGLWVDRESHRLVESVVVDLFGNRTALRLTDVVENGGTKPEDFVLEVPEGTEVIDLR